MLHKTPAYWYRPYGVQSALLQPFAWMYQLGECMNRKRAKPQAVDVPVVAIGNAVAGGGGKTPTTIAVVHMLKQLGHTPHIVTRGYGRATKELLRVEPNATAQEVGDEPLLLASHAPCWVYQDRYEAAKMAVHAGASVIVMDDGLQHYTLKQDVRLLCVSGTDGFGNGALLPAGPLRQPISVLLPRIDATIVIGALTDASRAQLQQFKTRYSASLVPQSWEVQGKSVIAFAGIARPERFFSMLQQEGAQCLQTHAFADHAPYSDAVLSRMHDEAKEANAELVTTAKDYARLPESWKAHVRCLDVNLRIPEQNALMEQLQQSLSRVYNDAA